MLKLLSSATETVATAASVAGSSIDVKEAKGVGLMCVVTNSAPAAGAFTAVAATDVCTKAAHGFLTGLKVQVSTTTTLPAPLAAATDYFIIKIDANTFYFATSLANAQAGTRIDLTDAGTGTHTVTPTALAGASIKLQGSMDDVSYADLPIISSGDITKNQPITASGNLYLEKIDPMLKFVRPYVTLTAGQLSIVTTSLVKGD